MSTVRVGVIGCGGMGSHHAQYIADGQIPGAELVAVCDVRPERMEWARQDLGDNVKTFEQPQAFFEADLVDAVFIATVHYDHPPLAIEAFKRGLHVLTEKPAGVYTRHVRQMNEAAARSGKVFAIMFNQRTLPIHRKLKDLVHAGELGPIKRTNWIVTNWYRPQSYYDAGGWRATWAGEGGGVLLNQCPHQLDLWQWICGMPKRVRAFCGFGKYHDIEVEDDVTAFVEYDNGATGVFIGSTGEAPGTNRLEIAGDMGKIIMEDGKLIFWRSRVPERRFNREHKTGFGGPECWKCEIPVSNEAAGHMKITENWIRAILDQTPLIAGGEEGIRSLELSNAMLLSSWIDDRVELPIDEDLYHAKLQERIKSTKTAKQDGGDSTMAVTDSF